MILNFLTISLIIELQLNKGGEILLNFKRIILTFVILLMGFIVYDSQAVLATNDENDRDMETISERDRIETEIDDFIEKDNKNTDLSLSIIENELIDNKYDQEEEMYDNEGYGEQDLNDKKFHRKDLAVEMNDLSSENEFTELSKNDSIVQEVEIDEMSTQIDEIVNSDAQDVSMLYRIGDSGDHIVLLKESLVRLGFANWASPTNVYGPITAGVVKEFQKYYGLQTTGIADEVTRAKMDEVLTPPYRVGDRGEAIVELKEKLVQLGFASWSNPSQYYGPITITVVNKFQDYYGFEQSDVISQEMLEKIDLILTGDFSIGDSGTHVIDLKEKLVLLGFASWRAPSNSYGPITARVVRDFQEYYDLPNSGIADEITQTKMNEVLALPYRSGDRGQHIVEFKEKLVQLGFASWKNPSQFYGNYTIKAFNKFQEYYNFDLTDIVTEDHISKINELLTGQYSNGDRGEHVVALKEDLVSLGFASWKSPSNSYGPITANVVKKFQRYYGLPISGIADQLTLKTLKDAKANLVPRFENGDRGDHVVELKKKLVQLGFAKWSNPTQYYGSNTIAAVNRFQAYYGLPVTKKVTPETFNKIDDILNGQYNLGDSGPHIVELKEKLVILGFANWSNPSGAYGKVTSNVVKRFQKAYGLIVNGIADEITLAKIDNNIVKIFIDPGHGGKDPGGQGFGLDEKDIVLDIALKTANMLSKNYLGVDVRLSRTNDTFYELVERANMANEWNADYYLSLHTNAHNGIAHGFESFIFNGKVSNETVRKQREIHNYLINKINRLDRGMKRANFSVLRNTEMPSLLLEYMFIDHPNENKLLRNASYRTALAKYTAEALAQSFNLQRR
ncbi:MAG: hypothetical protein GX963_11575 [Bacteroidales bacterium]|nr:hypothetical protein [Bacteroidales bacterium]